MRRKPIGLIALAFLVGVVAFCATGRARVQAQELPYPAMSPLDRYLIPDENSEVVLARSAAPPSISDQAEVMVLGRGGYTTASKGGNGFVCLVQRSWAAATDFPEFWNARILAPSGLRKKA